MFRPEDLGFSMVFAVGSLPSTAVAEFLILKLFAKPQQTVFVDFDVR